ncbi:MAG: LptF/LptG family permease [Planctomycetaceae bacterium]|nr:LptF/LptG family permease [Planctomycetaceae bacterium]
MGKTFDRYLLHRFLFMFVGFFAASMGLFAVVDGFTNLDGFQSATRDQGTLSMLAFMGRNYLYRSSWVFDLIGPTLVTMSAVAVIALLIRHGELNPLLAAGVPTYRLSRPLIVGVIVIHVFLCANKEFVLPRIAIHLTDTHGQSASDAQLVETQPDRLTGMYISGDELIRATRTLRGAEFLLGGSRLVREYVTLKSNEAVYYHSSGSEPAGWKLIDVRPRFEELKLTDLGAKTIIPQPNGTDVFVITDVSCDQLHNKGTSFKLLSTPDLIRRVQRPTSGASIQRAQLLHLHERLTRPILNIIGIFLVMPLLIRRESRSLVSNIAVSMAVLALIVGLTETFMYMGKAGLISPDTAIWIPLMIGGAMAAWLSPRAQT